MKDWTRPPTSGGCPVDQRCQEIGLLLSLAREQLRRAIHETDESQLTKNLRQAVWALTSSHAWAHKACVTTGAGPPANRRTTTHGDPRPAVDQIADLLDLPIEGDEPLRELAPRCAVALRERLREADGDAMVAAMWRTRRAREREVGSPA